MESYPWFLQFHPSLSGFTNRAYYPQQYDNIMKSIQRKRLLVISGTFHPDIGGPPTYLMNLLTDFIKNEPLDITVITHGVNTIKYPFKVIRVPRKIPLPLRLLLFSFKCFYYAKSSDIIFISDYGLPVALGNMLWRKPAVMKIVGDHAWEYSRNNGKIGDMSIDDFQTYQKTFHVKLLKLIQRFYAKRVDKIVTPSYYLKKIISGWGVKPQKIKVIFNAVDDKKYSSSLSKEKSRQLFNLPPDKTILLTVARLTAWKGLDEIIEQMSLLKNGELYVIAGDGPDERRLKALANEHGVADRVLFIGRVQHDIIPHLYRAADIFILNSGYEGLPHVILEATAAGLPCLVSDQEGIREAVERTQGGYVLSGDLEADIKKALSLKTIHLPPEFLWTNMRQYILDTVLSAQPKHTESARSMN